MMTKITTNAHGACTQPHLNLHKNPVSLVQSPFREKETEQCKCLSKVTEMFWLEVLRLSCYVHCLVVFQFYKYSISKIVPGKDQTAAA